MHYLFVSRKNVHARYYKTLLQILRLDAQVYIMGSLSWLSFKNLKRSFKTDLSQLISEQLERKKAYNSIWKRAFLSWLYSISQSLIEHVRYAKYLDLFSDLNPQCLVIWNGKKLPNVTVVMAAKSLGIDVFYFENGLLPNTVSLDPNGVNNEASLSRDPQFYLNLDLDNIPPFETPEIIPRANIKKRISFSAIDLPERFIFIPFQVPHDTQIVCYSNWIKSMEALYQAVIDAIERTSDADVKLVFKEHPTWHKHYRHLYNSHPRAVFANGNSTTELIEKSQAVITINSTVGLESLLLDKPVISLGEACYNIEGLVQKAHDINTLADCIDNLSKGWKMNEELRNKFFTYLQSRYCIPRVKKDDPNHIKAVELRLTHQDEFSLDLAKGFHN